MSRWTADEESWLRERYGSSDVHDVTRMLNEAFDSSRSERAVYQKANEMGLCRPVDAERRRGAERRVRWSSEPEMAAFMREADTGSRAAAIDRFERRFGFRLTPEQVSAFRAFAGTQSKAGRSRAQDWRRVPVGTERESKGYIVVKVREDPDRPGSKDNWRPKQAVVWERANGRRLPEGCTVMFADGDRRNFDPGNLVAVPRRLIGLMNSGPRWFDRGTLEAAMSLARLKLGVSDACSPRAVCGVCGSEFEPDIRSSSGCVQRTCRSCLDRGLRAPKSYGEGRCPGCGATFKKRSAHHVYCTPECRDRAYYERRKAWKKRS